MYFQDLLQTKVKYITRAKSQVKSIEKESVNISWSKNYIC